VLRKLAFILLALSVAASAQTAGQLTPSVAAKADAKQTYALYLPSKFDASRRWPVLYLFDPGARGAEAAEHFRAAAEQLGYIVAASNVSRNGPAEASMNALQAMSLDVESRFPTDPQRRYVAGFSGGARAAFTAGMVCSKCFAGVLGFGAGLPVKMKIDSAPDFAYLAGVGDSDFNYAEITSLAPTLDKIKADYRILTYEGTHDWPNAASALEALSWMDFQAIKHGTLAKPAGFPDTDWNTRLSAAKASASVNLTQVAREYDSIVRDFQGLHDTQEVSAELNRLRSSSDYKKAVKDERRIAETANSNAESFDRYLQAMLAGGGAGDKQQPRAEAVQLLNQMRADAQSKDRSLSTIARRTLSSSFVTLLQTREQLKPAETESAIDLADLATILYPDRPDTWYWLAIAHTNAGHRRPAVAALKKAVDLGASKSKISEDKRLAPLAGEADFKALIAK
jgi:poly(3-hydroxybutyrate) depolymerase